MPAMKEEQFTRLNLMAGTARSLEQELLTREDVEVWERDFALLCDDLSKLVDPELGADLRAEKAFYDAAMQVAKGYFDKLPFGGLKPATGQYGFRLAAAQDLKAAPGAVTAKLYSWVQTLSTGATDTKITKLLGAGAAVYTCNAANSAEVLAFHRLISYKPSPRIIYVLFTINDYPYAPYCVEPFSKIDKQNKLFKTIPMPGRVILHPGGSMYCDVYVETNEDASPTVATTLDFEVGVFGLVFGEYDYLKAASIK